MSWHSVIGESNSKLLEGRFATQAVWLKLRRLAKSCFKIETAVFGRESMICETAVAGWYRAMAALFGAVMVV